MPRAKKTSAAELLEELRRDPALRDELLRLLGDGVATRADLGRVFDRLGEHATILERLVEAVSLQGRRLEELTLQVAEQGKRLEEHSRVLQEHSRRLEEHSRILEEHSRRLEELTQRLEEHSRRLEELGQRLEEHSRRLEELGRRLEELTLQVAEQGKRIEEQGKRIEEQGKRIEEQGKRIEEQGKRIEEQGRRIEEAFRRVEAMGARWGLHAESAFREGMRSVLAERFGARVERWEGFDDEGTVYGHPSPVELDLVVQDGEPLLIEVKSHVSRGDVAAFHRKARLYEQKTGKRAAKMMVSPSVEERAFQIAEKLGIEISTSLA
ncbi:MAG: hypothetical protein KatS3mg076_1526 [Candidatus Binatia bacterium]|nr:MAG: hypothetical protein KatS3mg076_1526 [Candidatus Binatia bacterium]